MKWSFIPELRIAAWGFAFNALWEGLQTPLYADRSGGALYLIRTRLHCAIGDVLILLGCYWVVALLWRERGWSATHRLAPRLLFVALGLTYTAAGELLHTRFFLSWAYAPEMPRIFGVGLAPILQWVLIPSVLLFILGPSRARERPAAEGRADVASVTLGLSMTHERTVNPAKAFTPSASKGNPQRAEIRTTGRSPNDDLMQTDLARIPRRPQDFHGLHPA